MRPSRRCGDGVTRTLFGRERPIPDIDSRNPNARGFAERTAVNSPLQGTAADLIKLAMVRIDAALQAGGYRSAMLLQVHDELVFECPPEEVEAVSKLVKREMEGACQLKVPLVVDLGVGDNLARREMRRVVSSIQGKGKWVFQGRLAMAWRSGLSGGFICPAAVPRIPRRSKYILPFPFFFLG